MNLHNTMGLVQSTMEPRILVHCIGNPAILIYVRVWVSVFVCLWQRTRAFVYVVMRESSPNRTPAPAAAPDARTGTDLSRCRTHNVFPAKNYISFWSCSQAVPHCLTSAAKYLRNSIYQKISFRSRLQIIYSTLIIMPRCRNVFYLSNNCILSIIVHYIFWKICQVYGKFGDVTLCWEHW